MKPRMIKVHNCRDVAKHVCENLGAHLNDARCREIRRHLKQCPNCSAYLDSLRKTVKLYRSIPDPKLPSSVRKRLIAVVKLRTTNPSHR